MPRGSVPPPRRSEPSTRSTPTVVVPWEYDPPRDYYLGRQPWGWGFGSRSPYYYEPNHRWYGGYRYPAYYYPASGSLRLKMKPRNAQVYVDGYYVGVVDDFDGVFQKLRLGPGPHRIEVRARGYEAVVFDVYVRFDDTTTFEGDLRRIR